MAVSNFTGGRLGNVGNQPGTIESLKGLQNPSGKTIGGAGGAGSAESAEFRRTLEQLSGTMNPAGLQPKAAPTGVEKLKFSNHAIERMRSRGISYAPETMAAIENGVAKAAAKGSKDTLVLTGESALIVNVKNNTVVTVMDRTAMKENVFTNIDSTVMV